MDENNVTPNNEPENLHTQEVQASNADVEPVAMPKQTPAQPSVNQSAPEEAAPGKGMSIAAMVLGIVALVLFCTAIVAIICSVLAIIFAAISLNNKRPGRGMAITGLVTGIVALAPAITVLVVAGVGFSSAMSCMRPFI